MDAPKLLIKNPLGRVTELPLSGDVYSIGRAPENDIVLESTHVSRRHGSIFREGRVFLIADLESRNGIQVNGQAVRQVVLKEGDVIRIGNFVLMYQEEERAGQATTFPETITVEADYDHLVAQWSSLSGGATQVPQSEPSLPRMRQERKTLALLYELSRSMAGVHSLEEVAGKAIQALLGTTQAERAAILLLEGDAETLRPFRVGTRDGSETEPGSVAVSSTVANRILSERKAITTVHAGEDPRFAHAESVVRRGLRSVACAPLVGTIGNLGILYLENNRSVGAFTEDDLELLCAVAAQVGLSVEHARLFEALQRSNEELERKVEERTTQLRESQLKLYQAEKMASLSRLVAGVAHEMNNPLGALKANLEMSALVAAQAGAGGRDGREAHEELQRLARDGIQASTRILNVVQALRKFARLDESEFKPADVNEGLRVAVQLLDPSIRRGIQIDLDLAELPPIPCYPALLNEAFTNLLDNACQATPETGRVVVRTRAEGDYVRVDISDTGVGIPEEEVGKIFDPGYTTRGVRVGIGLGLAIVYNVVREHHGEIQVTSKKDQGSTFHVRLPMVRPAPEL